MPIPVLVDERSVADELAAVADRWKIAVVAVLVGVVALVALLATGRTHGVLASVGLGKDDCVVTDEGTKFCGEAADEYQRALAEAKQTTPRYNYAGDSTGSIDARSLNVDAPTDVDDLSYAQYAQANVRASVPAIEAFYADNGTYRGLNNPADAERPGISYYDPASASHVTVVGRGTRESYCVESTVGAVTYSKRGPAGYIVDQPC